MRKNEFPENLTTVHLDEVDSTNNYFKANYDQYREKLPLLVTADCQKAGRGRDQRRWVSRSDVGIYSSFCFAMDSTSQLNLLPLIPAISVIETLEQCSGVRGGLKWPNDVLVENKKIAGILIENMLFQDRAVCVAGIGINLNHTVEDFPPDLKNSATSLKILTGKRFNPADILPLLAQRFFYWLERINENRGRRITTRANELAVFMKDKNIRFHHQNTIMEGVFKGIEDCGGLILETPEGSRTIYYSGELSFSTNRNFSKHDDHYNDMNY